jgi:excisionase family DNA binding protein
MSDDTAQWLGTRQAAERIGVTQRTLYRFIDDGKLPAYKFGRVIRVKIDDVDLFIDASRIQPGELSHLVAGDDDGEAA